MIFFVLDRFISQKAESIANVSMERSLSDKNRDEQELVLARKRERSSTFEKPTFGRHSRFGGTYIIQNVKSISNRDLICHKPLQKAVDINFDSDKNKQKSSSRVAKDDDIIERRSAFSIRFVNTITTF